MAVSLDAQITGHSGVTAVLTNPSYKWRAKSRIIFTMRKSDRNKKNVVAHYRHRDRFYQQNEQWFFQTRDDGARGPFKTRQAAERELGRFTDTMEFVEENEKHLPSGLDWKNVTFVDMDALPNEIRRNR